MSTFTTRIELHGATTQQDYTNLHAAMERQGFSRTIRADEGRVYHLPWAEYNWEGTATIDQIVTAASTAASTTQRTFSILVSEAVRRSWLNLTAAG